VRSTNPTVNGSEAGSYLRLIDFVYHSTLGLGVIKKKKNSASRGMQPQVASLVVHVTSCVLTLAVFKAHRLVYHSTLGVRVMKKKKTRRPTSAHRRGTSIELVQGYLAHKTTHPPRTLP